MTVNKNDPFSLQSYPIFGKAPPNTFYRMPYLAIFTFCIAFSLRHLWRGVAKGRPKTKRFKGNGSENKNFFHFLRSNFICLFCKCACPKASYWSLTDSLSGCLFVDGLVMKLIHTFFCCCLIKWSLVPVTSVNQSSIKYFLLLKKIII